MQKIITFAAILGLTSSLLISGAQAAKDETATETAAPPSEAPIPDPVAIVNGEPISKAIYEAYAEQRQAQMKNTNTNSPEAHKALTDELVTQELLVQQAEKQNLDKDAQFTLQMEMIRRNLLASTLLRQLLAEKTPDEKAIEQEYEKAVVAMQAKKEFKARHILVDSEDKAKSIIAEIKKGADFSELAKTYSNDSSNSSGGDLGWFNSDVMVPPFAEAVAKLEKGNYTEEPVKTQFGWHVIMLDDVRDSAPPTIDAIRPQLVQKLQSEMLNNYVAKLREEAKVQIE